MSGIANISHLQKALERSTYIIYLSNKKCSAYQTHHNHIHSYVSARVS